MSILWYIFIFLVDIRGSYAHKTPFATGNLQNRQLTLFLDLAAAKSRKSNDT
jgi:hypothetical protein